MKDHLYVSASMIAGVTCSSTFIHREPESQVIEFVFGARRNGTGRDATPSDRGSVLSHGAHRRYESAEQPGSRGRLGSIEPHGSSIDGT